MPRPQIQRSAWIPAGRAAPKPKTSKKPVYVRPEIPARAALATSRAVAACDVISDLLSSSSSSSIDLGTFQAHGNLRTLQNELHLLRLHCGSLRTSSQFLHRSFDVFQVQEPVLQDLLEKVDECILQFNISFDDIEHTITFLENSSALHENHSEQCKKLLKTKEYLLSRILETYEKVTLGLQVALESLKAKQLTQFQSSQDTLRRDLQTARSKVANQEAAIKDLERKLGVSQAKINVLEDYKAAIESTRNNLQKQLALKNTQIKDLSNELMRLNSTAVENKEPNEELLDIIHKIRITSQSEKEGLRKFTKQLKLRCREKDTTIEQLKTEMKQKEDVLMQVSAERDYWKMQLTVSKNTIIECKNQLEESKSHIKKLTKNVSGLELEYKEEVQKLNDTLTEKTNALDDLKRDYNKLDDKYQKLKEECGSLPKTSEMATIERDREIDSPDVRDHGNLVGTLDEVKGLVTVLQGFKEHFKQLKTSSPTHTLSRRDQRPIESDSIQGDILLSIKEIKENLHDVQKQFNKFASGDQRHVQSTELEKKYEELKCLYRTLAEEKKMLQLEVDNTKRYLADVESKSKRPSVSDDIFSSADRRGLQSDMLDKINEIKQLKCDHQKHEKELQNQIADLKERLHKQEVQHEMKVLNFEEDLRKKNFELSSFEQRKHNEEERLNGKIRTLQSSLDSVTASYESLQKYVKILKSSYFNVFGVSSSQMDRNKMF